MKLPPGVLENNVLRIDSTGFGQVTDCSRKGWHSQAWRRVLVGRDEARGFGSAIHAAMDVRQKWLARYAKTVRYDNGSKELATLIDAVHHIQQSLDKSRELATLIDKTLEREFEGVVLADDEHRTLGRAKEVMGEYCQKYPSEEFEILASEQAGEFELGEVDFWREDLRLWQKCEVIWQFKIDGIWESLDEKALCIKDTKTAVQANLQHEQAKYQMSVQMKMYCWAAGKLLGRPVNDAVIDLLIIRKPTARPSKLARNEFHRFNLSYTDGVLAECRRDVLFKISQWLSACARPEPPPMDGAPGRCISYGKLCPYWEVCEQTAERDRIAWLMGSRYVENTWDPLAESAEVKEKALTAEASGDF